MEFSAGREVAHYRIERVLASGGMATIYLAEDTKHTRQVAIKVMKPEVAAAIGPERFHREIRFAAGLTHPHILPLHDSGEEGGQLYYVTPYIVGESLRARLDRDGPLPVEESIRLAREIASALSYAHRQGVIHRDIKPDNVLLADGIALVADFGIARAVDGGSRDGTTGVATEGGAILGTPKYMSPEQASGGEVDARADIYALACVVYEMLTGQPPFVGPTLGALIRQHLAETPRPVTERRSSVSPAISSAVAKGLAKRSADRYETAARFAEALTLAVGAGSGPAEASAAFESATPHNLPKQRTSFVGRERDQVECARLLHESRLVTITGIGGSGKTRLAIRVAERVLGDFPDGVWFLDFAPLSDPGRVAESVATALGVREEAGRTLTETLRRHARGKRLVVILDNCEHLLAACSDVANMLLEATDDLRILATSREGLGLPGERVYPLRSLAMPPVVVGPGLRVAETSEAVALFTDRARLAFPEFSLTEENAAGVLEICRRLDGIPLALELAAARMKVLSVDQVRARLDDRFRLLAGGSSAALPRHQTLRATIQWSYDQLDSEEQRLFRALSVFAGGWTLGSAARVAGEDRDEFEIMEILERLVDKSFVLVDRDPRADPRYGMLETVREYGQERLIEDRDAPSARRRHLVEFLAIAEQAHAERIVREDAWGRVIEAELDNMRAAVRFARDSDPERFLEVAGAVAWFWQTRSHFNEGRENLSAALAASISNTPRPALARALWGAASLAGWKGDTAAARPLMNDAIRMWRDLGNSREVANGLEGLGYILYLGGEDEAARPAFEESLRLQREIGDAAWVNRAMVGLAQVLVALNDVGPARALAAEILAYAKSHDDRRSEHFALHYIGDSDLIEENYEVAVASYRRSLELALAIGDRLETSFEIQGVAMSLSGLGRLERALRLAGAVEAEWERLGADIHVRFWDALLDRHIGGARSTLGPDAGERARREGRALSFEAAAALALEE